MEERLLGNVERGAPESIEHASEERGVAALRCLARREEATPINA